MSSPAFLRRCILVSFQIRRGIRPPPPPPVANPDLPHLWGLKLDGPSWEFHGLLTTVARFVGEEAWVPRSPYIHHFYLQNIIIGWDIWVSMELLLDFPGSHGLEGKIQKDQDAVRKGTGCDQPYFDRNDYADKNIRGWTRGYQDMALQINARTVESRRGW